MTEAEQQAKEVKELAEKIEKKYDEKIEKMKVEEDDKNLAKIEELNRQYDELKQKVSAARKEGKEDAFFAHMALMEYKPKIMMAKATGSNEDLQKAENVLKEASKELNEAIAKKYVNIKKEVEEKVRQISSNLEGKEDKKELKKEVKEDKKGTD